MWPAPWTVWIRDGVPGTGSCEPGPSPVRLRGVGAASSKSRLLLSVSIEPPPLRLADWGVLVGGGGPAPSKELAPAVADEVADQRPLLRRADVARAVAGQGGGLVHEH